MRPGRLVVTLAGALTLSSCVLIAPSDPGMGGYTGVGVDTTGAPVAYIVMCSGQVDALRVGTPGIADDPPTATLETTDPVTTSAEVRLAAPGSAWDVKTPLSPLRAGATYSVGAHARNWDWTTESTPFTTTELTRLAPGQVLWQKYDNERDTYGKRTSDAGGFRTEACDNL